MVFSSTLLSCYCFFSLPCSFLISVISLLPLVVSRENQMKPYSPQGFFKHLYLYNSVRPGCLFCLITLITLITPACLSLSHSDLVFSIYLLFFFCPSDGIAASITVVTVFIPSFCLSHLLIYPVSPPLLFLAVFLTSLTLLPFSSESLAVTESHTSSRLPFAISVFL